MSFSVKKGNCMQLSGINSELDWGEYVLGDATFPCDENGECYVLEGGLLAMRAFEHGLDVAIPKWERVDDGDTLYIILNSTEVSRTWFETVAGIEFPYKLTIDKKHLNSLPDGDVSFEYKVESDSGATSTSKSQDLKIDREAPEHGNAPEPLIFPEEVGDTITGEYLEANNNRVIATVPHYKTIEAGQKVTPSWDVEEVDFVIISDQHVKGEPIEVVFTSDLIKNHGEGRFTAKYFLTSRAGKDGLESHASTINVNLTPQPKNVQPTKVLSAVENYVDLEDVYKEDGVVIQIEEYENARAGDFIQATWGNKSLATVGVIPGKFPIDISVPNRIVIESGSSDDVVDVDVEYQVLRGSKTYAAQPVTVQVDIGVAGPTNPDPDIPENSNLSKLTIKGSSENDNELTVADKDKGATATVPYYQEAKVDEVIKVLWGESKTVVNTYTIKDEDIEAKEFPVFDVPANIVNETPTSDSWPASYSLSRKGDLHPNPNYSPFQAVRVLVSIPGGSGGLEEAIFVDKNHKGWLIEEAITQNDGARVEINAYENMREGDVVNITWEAYKNINGTDPLPDTEYKTSVPITENTIGQEIKFTVPVKYIDKINEVSGKRGSGKIIYSVTQLGFVFDSKEAVVPIDLGHPYL